MNITIRPKFPFIILIFNVFCLSGERKPTVNQHIPENNPTAHANILLLDTYQIDSTKTLTMLDWQNLPPSLSRPESKFAANGSPDVVPTNPVRDMDFVIPEANRLEYTKRRTEPKVTIIKNKERIPQDDGGLNNWDESRNPYKRRKDGFTTPIADRENPIHSQNPQPHASNYGIIEKEVVKFANSDDEIISILTANHLPYDYRNGEFILDHSVTGILRQMDVLFLKIGRNFTPDASAKHDSTGGQNVNRNNWTDNDDNNLDIPDYSGHEPFYVESTLTCANSGTVWNVEYSLLAQHPYPGDLDIFIVHNSGVEVQHLIWQHNYFITDDNGLDDDPEADDDIYFTDRITNAFDGMDAGGTWSLQCWDVYAGYVGTLDWWSITVYFGNDCVTEAPFDEDDACYQEVIESDSYCCTNIWDTTCDNEYWNCYSATCVEMPFVPVDNCYEETVMNDNYCCDTQWDNICQCSYMDCVGGGADIPQILSAEIVDAVDSDEDGYLESWGVDLYLDTVCEGTAPNVLLNFTDDHGGFSYEYGPFVLDGSGDSYYFHTSGWDMIDYDMDGPEEVVISFIISNYYGSDEVTLPVMVDRDCVASPYLLSDTCYQTVVGEDTYCCSTLWDSICEDEYWACYSATCVEAPYDSNDDCYLETIINDPHCCDTDWNLTCVCDYHYCTPEDDSPFFINSVDIINGIDDDDDGWLESWDYSVLVSTCLGTAANVMLHVLFTGMGVDYGIGTSLGNIEPGGVHEFILTSYRYSSTFLGLDTPQDINFTIFAINDYMMTPNYEIDVPVDTGCAADLPEHSFPWFICYDDVISTDSYCCDTAWDDSCEAELWDCYTADCVNPYPIDDTCYQDVISFNYYNCCGDWNEYCQMAYSYCVDTACNDIPGDINQDGMVDVTDIINLVGIILELLPPAAPCEFSVADLVPDGTLNVSDVVNLVGMILNPAMTAASPVTQATLYLSGTALKISAVGQVAGIQLETEGDFSISTSYLPENWKLQRSDHIILIFSNDGSPLDDDRLFSFDGDLTIRSGIVADWHSHSISADLTVRSDRFELLGAYPNPFNPATDITYNLPRDSRVDLAVYNVLGKRVEQLVKEKQTAGQYHIWWDAATLPSGIYFVKMVTPEDEDTQQLLLLK